MSKKAQIKAYIADVVALVILTVAAVFLTLARLDPKTIRDKTPRMRILEGE
jgi:hypothetical protein